MPSFIGEWLLAVSGRYCFIIDFEEVDKKVQRRAKASSLTFEDVGRLSKSGKKAEYASYMASYQAECDEAGVSPHFVLARTWRGYTAAYRQAVNAKVLQKVLTLPATAQNVRSATRGT